MNRIELTLNFLKKKFDESEFFSKIKKQKNIVMSIH